MRGALAVVMSALVLVASLELAHARRNVNGPMPGAVGPKGVVGKTARFGMKASGRVGQLAGVAGMVVGAATLNPFIFGGGMMAAATGTILNRAGKRWGDPSYGQPKPSKGNIFGRTARFGMRTTGRLTKWFGIGAAIVGLLTLNPFLLGGGALAAVGGHAVKKVGQAGPGFGFGDSGRLSAPGSYGGGAAAGAEAGAGAAGAYQMMDYDGDGLREGRMEMGPGGYGGFVQAPNNPALGMYPGFAR